MNYVYLYGMRECINKRNRKLSSRSVRGCLCLRVESILYFFQTTLGDWLKVHQFDAMLSYWFKFASIFILLVAMAHYIGYK